MMYRQGDVLVTRLARRPTTLGAAVPGRRVILAYGEVTGHAHEVIAASPMTEDRTPAQFFEAPDGSRYLLVESPCALVHQEHGTIALAPGAYRVTRQREYHPQAIRPVAD